MYKVIFKNEVYDADCLNDISEFVIHYRIAPEDIKVFQGDFYKKIDLFDENGWINHKGHFYHYNSLFSRYYIKHQPYFPKNKAAKNRKPHKVYKQKGIQIIVEYESCYYDGFQKRRSRKGRCWKDQKIRHQYDKNKK